MPLVSSGSTSCAVSYGANNLTPIEKSVGVAQRQLADAQSALLAVEEESIEYRSRLGIKARGVGSGAFAGQSS